MPSLEHLLSEALALVGQLHEHEDLSTQWLHVQQDLKNFAENDRDTINDETCEVLELAM